MSEARILLVDSEVQVHRVLKPALEMGGYSVSQAYTARDGLRLAVERVPAAILLDLALPDFDGRELILRLRAFSRVPIVVVSAHDAEAVKIEALDHGADDFIDKPFLVGELLARLRACLRHSVAFGDAPYRWRVRGVEVDLQRQTVFVDGQEVCLTPREYDLLAVLFRNTGVVLTHRQLLTAVWGTDFAEDLQYLRVYIGLLRQKLGHAGASIILTASRVGYRVAEAQAEN